MLEQEHRTAPKAFFLGARATGRSLAACVALSSQRKASAWTVVAEMTTGKKSEGLVWSKLIWRSLYEAMELLVYKSCYWSIGSARGTFILLLRVRSR